MSHFAVLVITDEIPTEDVIEYAMQPFHEYECTGVEDEYVIRKDMTEEALGDFESEKERYPNIDAFLSDYYGIDADDPYLVTKNEAGEVTHVYRKTNPNAQWDWWQVGGRWSGLLRAKPGATGKNTKGGPGFMGSQVNASGLDSVRVGDIDWDLMAAFDKQRRHDRVRETIDAAKKAYGPGTLRHDVIAALEAGRELLRLLRQDYEKAGRPTAFPAFIDEHPSGQLFRSNKAYNAFQFRTGLDLENGPPLEEWLKQDPEPLCLFAFIKDGEWVSRGNMGWFGVSTTTDDNWGKTFAEMLKNLTDDQYITIVDCHI
jgi:hypothetical protein